MRMDEFIIPNLKIKLLTKNSSYEEENYNFQCTKVFFFKVIQTSVCELCNEL